MGAFTQFLYKKLVLLVGSSLFSVSRLLLPLFSFISPFLFRLHGNGSPLRQKIEMNSAEIIDQKDFKHVPSEPTLEPQTEPEAELNDVGFKELETGSHFEPEKKAKTDEVGFTESEADCEGESFDTSFTFRFPTFEEYISNSKKESAELFNSDQVSSTSSSKSDFFMSSESFNVEEIDAASHKHFTVEAAETFEVQSKKKPVDDGPRDEEKSEEHEATSCIPQETGDYDFRNEIRFDYTERDCVIVSDGHSESINSEPDRVSVTSDSYNDGFLSDEDFGQEYSSVVDLEASMDVSGEEVKTTRGETADFGDKDGESDDFGEEDSDILGELSKLEGELLEQDLERNPDAVASRFLSEDDFREDSMGAEADQDDKPLNGSYDSEKATSKDTCDFEDPNKLETLWEHQDLIEQLKMELRKVRATGLPTILEDSEFPKITEDLKPWKIDEKFQREDCMGELHKFYKSYRERMRKLDIFNYQKMYAIGFLQLKDPLEPISSPKTSGPILKSLLSQNFWQLKHKSSENEPMIKFVKDLQSDLEVVYVGQMCLSWEFLHWQYGKALDLWDSDPRGIHRYNEVAGEFQQFQVLLQRFIEDEHFQGPRVRYYVKRRCLLRNLLQVPVIREDNLRKGRRGERAEYVITSDMMVEIIEESIRIFWRFVRADKHCNSAMSKGHKGAPPALQNPGDLELLMEIKNILQKKERKLKDVVRGGNCILRRLRKSREDESDHVLYFFSQVDLKLVARVLNMSRLTTEQLVWCHSKLSRISIESRKIQVEPSFLLFPC
ncbi:unnamed protein product [Coffea canephora]|uniref:Ribosomal protein L34Ae n=1 Tax=Coffea canephora TaxID=49390 RepID=A0A068U256_COFCA|nr:unnamed protein product [Coffea canephora]